MRYTPLIGLVLAVLLAGCAQQAGNGNIVVTIADNAADMGAVTAIDISIDSVMVENAAGGWVTVSSTPVTVDLLQLKASGNQALLANAPLPDGSYNQVRLAVSSVVVADSTGSHQAKLPSGDLKIVGGFDVANNSVSVVKLDFQADRSLHVTGNGKYIFAPVIHLQTMEGADVDADNPSNVKVHGGSLKANAEVGMDENGTIGAGRQIPSNANVSVDANGKVRVNHPGQEDHGDPHNN